MSKRAALYARVSTAQQEQEQTVASQLEALDRAATAMGLTVPPDRRYIDEGISGARLDRPGLDALRDAAADGFLDLVLVYCPDRLARNFVHQHVLIEELTGRGVKVHFVEHPVGERAEDRLLMQMQGVIAEYERSKILERTRRGRIHKLRTGQSLPYGKEAPYGYAIEGQSNGRRVVVIDEVEARIVRRMYRWVIEEGLSARGIAKRLNAEGVFPRKAKRWMQSSIYRVLTSPAYIGLATYNRSTSVEPKRPKRFGAYRRQLKSSSRKRPQEEWITVPIPPIVGEQEQRQVRQILTKHKLDAARNLKYEYLLRSLVVCGECGWRMECRRQPPRISAPYEYFYYMCRKHVVMERGHDRPCTARRVRREELDAVVWNALVSWIQTPAMLEQEIEAWRSSREGAARRSVDRARLEATERRLQEQIDRLIDAFQAGAVSLEELKARRERLEAAKDAARTRREEIDAQDQDHARLDELADDVEAFAATLRSGLGELDFAGRQRLVRLLIERVVVTRDLVAIEHAIPLSGRFHRLRPQDRRSRVPTDVTVGFE